jgi:hypothetical protein
MDGVSGFSFLRTGDQAEPRPDQPVDRPTNQTCIDIGPVIESQEAISLRRNAKHRVVSDICLYQFKYLSRKIKYLP